MSDAHARANLEQARSDDVCVVIATGEMEIYANVTITIGVVNEGQAEE